MYGIGAAVEGVNRGVEQHRQIKRQESQDEQQRKLQEAQLENYGLRMDSTRQQMDQSATEYDWKAEDRNQLQITREENDMIERGRRLAQMAETTGDYTVLTPVIGEMFERTWGEAPEAVVPAEEGFLIRHNGQTHTVPFSESASLAMLTPEEWFETKQEAAKLRQEQEAEQAKASQEHNRWLQEQGVQSGALEVTQGEDGQLGLGYLPPDQRRRDPDPSSRESDVLAYAAAKGVSEGVAWDAILNRGGDPRPHVARIAQSLLQNDAASYVGNPQQAYTDAEEIYGRLQTASQEGPYGISGPQAPQGAARGLPGGTQGQRMTQAVRQQIAEEGEEATRRELEADGFDADAIINQVMGNR